MIAQTFVVGMLLTNCYVAYCEETKEAIVIDPGFADIFEAERIFKFIDKNSLIVKFVVNTHGHPDHTCGNGIVKEKLHVPILIHEYDAYMLGESGKKIADFFGFQNASPVADELLHEEDLVRFGRLNLKVLHTPGHSRGSISMRGAKEVFTGDTLFDGSIGRTDFPESSEEDMIRSLKKLTSLQEYFVVYPGHGSKTTIGKEKHSNPFTQW